MLSGTGQISEDENAQFSFTSPLQIVTDQQPSPAPAGLTCAQFAAGEGGSFAPPTFDVLSGNYKFYFEAVMASGYHGPGAYQSADEPSLTGTIAVDVGVAGGQQGAVSIFRSHINGSSTLTVHGDGSGTFDYSEWGSDEVRGNTGSAASVSGTVRWSCG